MHFLKRAAPLLLFGGTVAAIALHSSLGVASTAARAGTLNVHPCAVGSSKSRAECGTFTVYENRTTRTGRTIALRLVVLKAPRPTRDAIAFIAGGPGESSVQFAEPVADGKFEKALAALHDRYDIVFVDARGMGGSNPSHCDFAPDGDPAAYFAHLWADELVTSCRDRYGRTADLSQYNTNAAVDDLNQLRGALAYPKIVLYGGSYGTFTSLVYLRRHPASVETAVLLSAAPPGFMPLPGEPIGAQSALNDLERKCRVDRSCRAHFPQFGDHFTAVLARLSDGPLAVPLTEPKTKKTRTVQLSKEVFVDRLRELLYDPEGAAYVPYVIERAYDRDYAPLARIIDVVTQSINGGLDMAAALSYSCADWIPFLSEQRIEQAAAHSFAGDLRIRAQQHACALWNVPAMPASFNEPVRSTVPVLMISGSDDPATSPHYGESALRYLPNGRNVLVQGAGHAQEFACTDKLIVQFVRARSAKGLDVTRCRAAFSTPKFATSLAGL